MLCYKVVLMVRAALGSMTYQINIRISKAIYFKFSRYITEL